MALAQQRCPSSGTAWTLEAVTHLCVHPLGSEFTGERIRCTDHSKASVVFLHKLYGLLRMGSNISGKLLISRIIGQVPFFVGTHRGRARSPSTPGLRSGAPGGLGLPIFRFVAIGARSISALSECRFRTARGFLSRSAVPDVELKIERSQIEDVGTTKATMWNDMVASGKCFFEFAARAMEAKL